jgi:hypothetical protein
LGRLGYLVVHHHVRLTTLVGGEHHLRVPRKHPVRVGTLSAILRQVERHFGIARDGLIDRVFG